MSERGITQAPAIAPEARARMLDALYSGSYAQTMPREQFDAAVGSKSDLDIANATYEAFYKDSLPRDQFNQRIGLTSARGSTQAAVVQGATLGLADEVGAAVAALGAAGRRLFTGTGPTMGEAYDQTLTAQRQNMEVFRQNNPYVGRALEFAGGLASGGPARTALAGAVPSRAATVGAAAGLGAVAGGASAEGGLSDRLEGAAVGGAVGGAVAGAAPAVIGAVSGVVGRVGRALGLANDEKTATQLVLRAMADDGVTPDEAIQRLAQWRADGAKPAALFDLAGENTKRLARTAAGRIGPGTDRAVDFLSERQAGQSARVAADVTETLGQNADDFFARAQQLVASRSQSATPRYEAAFNRIRVTPEEYAQFQPFVRDNIGQEALQKGLRVIEIESLARGQPFDYAMYGVTRGPEGRFVIAEGQVPNLRLLDAVKRGFDEIVEGFRDPTSGRLALNQYGRAVNEARAAYTGLLRENFPRYGNALNAWAGPSRAMDAMAQGRNILNMRDEEVARLAAELRRTSGDDEFFRLGAAQAIRDAVMRAPDGADVVKRFFGSPQRRALLRAAFPDEATFRTFEARMNREIAMRRNADFVSPRTGSQTQMRQDEAGQFGEDAIDATAAMMTGIPPASVIRQWASNRMAGARGVTPGTADQITQRMFASPDDVLQQLQAAYAAQGAQRETSMLNQLLLYPRLSAAISSGSQTD